MARALELARRADHRTSPNPMVGSVVLDQAGELAGEGYHLAPGQPHAEREALDQAGPRARGGTIYSNLEPCSHQGRTGPCTEAIIAAGIRRVVTATLDPDNKVSGRGVEALRRAGIEVQVGVMEAEAERLNDFYMQHRRTGRPLVTAKFAISLDGKIATRTGESRWITGEPARAHAHLLRHVHDAVMVGVNTVITDDPLLTARPEIDDPRQPLRVVVDSSGRTPAAARLLKDTGAGVLVATTTAAPAASLEALRRAGAEVAVLASDEHGHVDLAELLDLLGARPILSVLVEGGGELLGSLFDRRLVDRVNAYMAPMLIGGTGAPGPIGGQGVARIEESLRLRDMETMALGEDLLISGHVHRDS
jgi:diaminohydroxyphosphoribosylaminopyrimidine deaminase/5-amino-6-(5-phosphoribosylamino)uracil reductase